MPGRKFWISLLACGTFMLFSLSTYALEVAEEELFGVRDRSVEFLNYIGPYSKIETAEQIRGIGEALGSPIEGGALQSGYTDRYQVIRVVDPSIPAGLDADIFIIGRNAQVDHIRNIRRILTGYFRESFRYSEGEASVLAEFSTYYNAVYRRDLEYFRRVYKEPVIRVLDPQKAGISTRYSEWPGNTQMLIPLRSGTDGIDTDLLSDDRVIEDLRERDDRGIEPRRDMIELREKELEEEQHRLEEEKRRTEEEAERVAEVREAVDEERAARPDPVRERELEEQERALAEEEERVERRREELEREEQVQRERQESISRERERIAEDAREIIEEEQRIAAREEPAVRDDDRETPPAEAVTPLNRIPHLLVRDEDGGFLGEIVLVNTRTGRIDRRSVNTVRGRRFLDHSGGILVVAGHPRPPQAVRLVLLDRESLEIALEGKDDIYPESDLLVSGRSIYAVTGGEGSWRVGRFDENLELTTVSENTAVLPYTQLNLRNQFLYVQDSRGSIIRLDPDNLSEER